VKWDRRVRCPTRERFTTVSWPIAGQGRSGPRSTVPVTISRRRIRVQAPHRVWCILPPALGSSRMPPKVAVVTMDRWRVNTPSGLAAHRETGRLPPSTNFAAGAWRNALVSCRRRREGFIQTNDTECVDGPGAMWPPTSTKERAAVRHKHLGVKTRAPTGGFLGWLDWGGTCCRGPEPWKHPEAVQAHFVDIRRGTLGPNLGRHPRNRTIARIYGGDAPRPKWPTSTTPPR